MKKEERAVYVALGETINATLCTFCHYGDFHFDGCCEGYAECQHPIEELSYQGIHQEDCEPGDDCYAFRPSLPVDVAADLTGAILEQDWDEWFYRKFSRRSVTVYGRHWQQGVENTGKVRIG